MLASSWDFGDTREDLIHRIHPYPARFPAFITTKALEYAKEVGVEVRNVADVFCGCGTTAVEAKRNGKDFWGCDINPLATLIAQVKTHCYRDAVLERTYNSIKEEVRGCVVTAEDRSGISERIRYWFDEDNIVDLIRLDRAIRRTTHPYSAHRKFFQCAFSAILKPTSYWLTKSIKAQRDPNKRPRGVLEAFEGQFELMRRANRENVFPRPSATTRIRARNFLRGRSGQDGADLIVTSPPYVTSYADSIPYRRPIGLREQRPSGSEAVTLSPSVRIACPGLGQRIPERAVPNVLHGFHYPRPDRQPALRLSVAHTVPIAAQVAQCRIRPWMLAAQIAQPGTRSTPRPCRSRYFSYCAHRSHRAASVAALSCSAA